MDCEPRRAVPRSGVRRVVVVPSLDRRLSRHQHPWGTLLCVPVDHQDRSTAGSSAAGGPYSRPVPVIGDDTSAQQRAADPGSWAMSPDVRDGLAQVIAARRDVRRYRPDPVPGDVLERVLAAGHAAPSVGHSQPWRFVVVTEPQARERAAWLADRERLAQAATLEPEAGRRLLDLQLEGIREAPLGIVVACDRRAPAAGVLGRATFTDTDLWSCACAIENMWLTARAEGLGLGWVTLFQPEDLAGLLGLPDGVVTLGWLCLGWPDERPPTPGLERVGWSARQPLSDVVIRERWPTTDVPPPVSKLRAPDRHLVVAARDDADQLLTPLGSLGVLDRTVDRVCSVCPEPPTGGTLVLVGGRHRVVELGVSAFDPSVGDDVLAAARAGEALGVVSARVSGLDVRVVDAGTASGDLLHEDALTPDRVDELLAEGREIGATAARRGLVVLGEVGIGNTTVAAALTAALLDRRPDDVVGLGASSDTAMLDRKREVVSGALGRARAEHGDTLQVATTLLAALGGPDVTMLTGVIRGAVEAGGVVVLDGLLTSVAALIVVEETPAAQAFLVAGQRSRELAHGHVLQRLGLEPLLDLRIRAGEGAGACLAAGLLVSALQVRAGTARTAAI